MQNSAQQEILAPTSDIVAYNPFYAQLEELKKTNAVTVFQYEDPKGNKDARSYVHKLRQTKAAVEKVRKEEKAASLEYGRKVDAEAKFITEQVESMIGVHQVHLDAIEQREKDRVVGIQNRIDIIKNPILHDEFGLPLNSEGLAIALQQVRDFVVDATFAEFMASAVLAKESSIATIEGLLEATKKREAEQAELERLRKEQAERDQKEREDRIAAEAAERATREAEAKAKAQQEEVERKAKKEREEAEERERRLKEAAERAEREKKDAEIRAEKAAQAERDRAKREADEKAAQDAKRENDKKHRAAINRAVLECLTANHDMTETSAKSLIEAIAKGEVPNVKITY